jgi:hypothetical protein
MPRGVQNPLLPTALLYAVTHTPQVAADMHSVVTRESHITRRSVPTKGGGGGAGGAGKGAGKVGAAAAVLGSDDESTLAQVMFVLNQAPAGSDDVPQQRTPLSLSLSLSLFHAHARAHMFSVLYVTFFLSFLFSGSSACLCYYLCLCLRLTRFPLPLPSPARCRPTGCDAGEPVRTHAVGRTEAGGAGTGRSEGDPERGGTVLVGLWFFLRSADVFSVWLER